MSSFPVSGPNQGPQEPQPPIRRNTPRAAKDKARATNQEAAKTIKKTTHEERAQARKHSVKHKRTEDSTISEASVKLRKSEEGKPVLMPGQPAGQNPLTQALQQQVIVQLMIALLPRKDQLALRQVDRLMHWHVQQVVTKQAHALLCEFTEFLDSCQPQLREQLRAIEPFVNAVRASSVDNLYEALYAARSRIVDILVQLPMDTVSALQNAYKKQLPLKFEQIFKIVYFWQSQQRPENERPEGNLLHRDELYEHVRFMDAQGASPQDIIDLLHRLTSKSKEERLKSPIDKASLTLMHSIIDKQPAGYEKDELLMRFYLLVAQCYFDKNDIENTLSAITNALGTTRNEGMFLTRNSLDSYSAILRCVRNLLKEGNAAAMEPLFAVIEQAANEHPNEIRRPSLLSRIYTTKAAIYLERNDPQKFMQYVHEALRIYDTLPERDNHFLRCITWWLLPNLREINTASHILHGINAVLDKEDDPCKRAKMVLVLLDKLTNGTNITDKAVKDLAYNQFIEKFLEVIKVGNIDISHLSENVVHIRRNISQAPESAAKAAMLKLTPLG